MADYLRPETLPEALDALAGGAFRIAAGCTDLFPATERKVMPGPVLDITAIPELRGITRNASWVRIGATTTWSDIIAADLPSAFGGLKLAAREVGAKQIQNRGTIAGNLCNASPAADGVPPLLTLEAEVELSSAQGVRQMPLQAFLLGPRQTDRAQDEILTAILVPESALAGQGHFLKLGARIYLVISIAMVAARVQVVDGILHDVVLAVGSCGPVATRLPDVEQSLIGQRLRDLVLEDALVAAALSPIDDVRADAVYRTSSAAELIRRVLRLAATEQEVAA